MYSAVEFKKNLSKVLLLLWGCESVFNVVVEALREEEKNFGFQADVLTRNTRRSFMPSFIFSRKRMRWKA